MICKKTRRFAALLLTALGLALGACAVGDRPGGTALSPSPQVSPPQSETPLPPQSGSSSPDKTSPPSQGGSSSPDKTSPPSQGGSPSPDKTSSPSQSGSPEDPPSPVETPAGLMTEGEDVGSDWFADAVFLGDSRTDGLRLYSGIRGASFICHAGLSVFTVGSNACIKSDGGKITAMDALAGKQYAKVYLMLGINELGYSTASFQKAYTQVVGEIKQLQPGAAIYLQTLIPVNEPIAYKNGTNRAINNEKLKQFNEVIAAVAEAENVCLVDVDTPFWSAGGCLAEENTGDGVHLTRAGYQAWYAYLRTHTGNGDPILFQPPEPPAREGSVSPYTPGPGDSVQESYPAG